LADFLRTRGCFSSIFLIRFAAGRHRRQLAHKIAAASGPGAFALEVTNHSSLDDKAAREVRSALEAELQAEGVQVAKAEQAMGTVEVVLSDNLREYVWSAEIVVGSDEKKVALVALPRSSTGRPFAPALPITLKKTLLFAQSNQCLTSPWSKYPVDLV